VSAASGFAVDAADRLALVTSDDPSEVVSLLRRLYRRPLQEAA
jgi:hypothetical protein